MKVPASKTYVFDAGTFKYPVPQKLIEKAQGWPSSVVLGVRPQDVIVHGKVQDAANREKEAAEFGLEKNFDGIFIVHSA